MQRPTTQSDENIEKGRVEFGVAVAKENTVMPSAIENQSGGISTVMSLMTNSRAYIVAAIVLSLFLVSGNQFGSVLAQPLADPVGLSTSHGPGYWSSVSEESDWPLYAPKSITATGSSNVYQLMAEENGQALYVPKTIMTTGFSNIYQLMAEESESGILS